MTASPVVDKIRKLLNLSKSSNVNEAASAAAMAQELMLAHEIEVADLEVTTGERAKPEAVHEEVLEEGNGRMQRWRLALAEQLCTAFGCDLYFCPGGEINVIGPVSGIQTVRYMQGFLALEIHRLCEESCDAVGYAVKPRVWRNQFKDGAVSAIGDRLREHRKEQNRKFAQTAASALVLVKRDEELVKKEIEKAMAKALGPRGGRHTAFGGESHRGAYDSGREAGQSINLGGNSRSLGGSKERLR